MMTAFPLAAPAAPPTPPAAPPVPDAPAVPPASGRTIDPAVPPVPVPPIPPSPPAPGAPPRPPLVPPAGDPEGGGDDPQARPMALAPRTATSNDKAPDGEPGTRPRERCGGRRT